MDQQTLVGWFIRVDPTGPMTDMTAHRVEVAPDGRVWLRAGDGTGEAVPLPLTAADLETATVATARPLTTNAAYPCSICPRPIHGAPLPPAPVAGAWPAHAAAQQDRRH